MTHNRNSTWNSLNVPGFEIPLVPTSGGLQSMSLVADSLLSLQNTCERIFGRIDKYLDNQCDRLNAVNDRIQGAKDRIEDLKGSRNALVVVSSPQFPVVKPGTDEYDDMIEGSRIPMIQKNLSNFHIVILS